MTTMNWQTEFLSRVPGLSPEAKELFASQSLPEYLHELEKAELVRDATLIVAASMPARDAIWWGCLCCETAFSGQITPVTWEALKLVGLWVLDPTSATGDELDSAAAKAGYATACGSLAKAAFFACLAGENVDCLEWKVAVRLVASAVLTCAMVPRVAPTALHQYLAVGIDVSRGVLRWQ